VKVRTISMAEALRLFAKEELALSEPLVELLGRGVL